MLLNMLLCIERYGSIFIAPFNSLSSYKPDNKCFLVEQIKHKQPYTFYRPTDVLLFFLTVPQHNMWWKIWKWFRNLTVRVFSDNFTAKQWKFMNFSKFIDILKIDLKSLHTFVSYFFSFTNDNNVGIYFLSTNICYCCKVRIVNIRFHYQDRVSVFFRKYKCKYTTT